MHRFEPGHPKYGGRKKGVKNHKPQMKSIRQSLADQDFDLGSALLDFLAQDLDPATRLKALELIAKYTQTAPREEAGSPPTLDNLEDVNDEALVAALDGFLQLDQ